MEARRTSGDRLVPGGGWARSTLQEVGRRNWIPARSKQHESGRTGAGMKTLMHAYSKTCLPQIQNIGYWSYCLSSYYVSNRRGERNTDVLHFQCQKCFVLSLDEMWTWPLIINNKWGTIAVLLSPAIIIFLKIVDIAHYAAFTVFLSQNADGQCYEGTSVLRVR